MVPSIRFSSPYSLLFAGLLLALFPSPTWAQQHFADCLPNTVNDASVVIPTDAPITVDGDSLETGDEVALYTNDGRCAGVAVWDTSASALSIAVADRDSTAGRLKGYEAGERLKYRIWRRADGQEFAVSSASYSCSLPGCRTDGQYARNGLYEVRDLTASSSALPVELATFEATRRQQTVVLTWRTASETNNAGFKVQHKPPSGASSSWTTLSFVEGAGTASTPQDYRYTARDLAYGEHEFRLAQIDRDGSRTTTETVDVEVTLDRAYAVSKVAPNPVHQTGSLEMTVKEPQKVVVRVYDLLGREVGTLLNETLPADRTRTLRLNARRLPSGQYFLRVRGETFRTTRRLTVVK